MESKAMDKMRLVDANAFWKRLVNMPVDYVNWPNHPAEKPTGAFEVSSIKEALEQTPTVDAAEVFHGKWEWVDDEECGIYRCSCCNQGSGYPTNHCPNCGATMDGGNAGMRMDRCKDCIHFGICKKGFPFADGKGGGWCEDFKRKANYVEVVLCEKCKNYVEDHCCRRFSGGSYEPFPMKPNDFCSYGERR